MPLPTSYLGGRVAAPTRVVLPARNNADKALAPGVGSDPFTAPISVVMKDSWATPAAASTTAFMSTGVAGPNTTTATYAKGSAGWDGALGTTGLPDFARNAVVTVTHASAVVALSGTITGIDRYGRALTEAWSVTAGSTSKTFTGKKAFYRIDSISITAAADASADTVKFGTGAVLGLSMPCSAYEAVSEVMDAAKASTAGTIIAAGADPADPLGTYTPNSAPNGSHSYSVWYVVDDPSAF